jgi:plasmid stability protein
LTHRASGVQYAEAMMPPGNGTAHSTAFQERYATIGRRYSAIVISAGGTLAHLFIRGLQRDIMKRLHLRARRHGRTVEAEAKGIIIDTLRQEDAPSGGLGTEIAALFREAGLENGLPELRGCRILPTKL